MWSSLARRLAIKRCQAATLDWSGEHGEWETIPETIGHQS